MAISNNYNYYTTRDSIIMRAFRILGAVGQGETAVQNAVAVTEAAEALNDLCKEWETDGMPLWKVTVSAPITMIASTTIHNIGINGGSNSSLNQLAPLKILRAFVRNTSTTADSPIILISQDEYRALNNKASTGQPNQLWYDPPGANKANTQLQGTINLFPTPDATTVSGSTLYFVAQYPFANFDLSTDVPDFPSYWNNALKWGLADQLAYEYGVGLSERSMIEKKAEKHKNLALSFGTEEGSYYLQVEDNA